MTHMFSSGAGAASRYSIGVVVVTGMLIGTLFTLFVLPTVYSLLARDHSQVAGSERAEGLAHEDVKPA
ncbi:efflux RND transporter permease subunit [Microbulbifer sp. MCCC 1A16149]|uniref:efflux RND transporter permease subunit n=1 Tax=Microbulbifer sp. MCCC 1A16149 TaxID=3411322 RepID=UPI003D11C1B8